MAEEDCTTCRFYGNGVEEDEGYCFRYPPAHTFKTKEFRDIYAVQPVVGLATWCGEYKQKLTPANE